MKTALIAGATGLVGNELLQLLSDDPDYDKIIVLSRRELKYSVQKTEVILTTFDNVEDLILPYPIDVCFCCLGTTRKKSGKAGFYKVDYEYVMKIASLSAKEGGKFLVVSSQGANPESPFFYMKTKGEMERDVLKSGNKVIYLVRPSLITGKREEFRFGEQVGKVIYTLFTPLMVGRLRRARPVSALKIARCLQALAKREEKGTFVIESEIIQDF